MEFRFDAKQEYQLEAIEAVSGLFDGQPKASVELVFPTGASFATVPNRLDLDESTILSNVRGIQQTNGLAPDDELKTIEAEIDCLGVSATIRFPNFSIEMETGTGKTYVYLRTALDLYDRYRFRKFIVVVPSVAVREGVLKTLRITEKHLRDIYHSPSYRYYVYESDNLSQVRQFAMSDGIEIMIMTIDAFNKATNVIRQSRDQLQGERPISLIQATRPVLILDEPQNMESEGRVQALAALNPLFALRYSATHRNPYNLVHRLTPFEAYRQGLVKKLAVASAVEDTNANLVFLRLDEIKIDPLRARIAVHKMAASGAIRESVVTVKHADALEDKTGRAEYRGFEVAEIDAGAGFVRFANNQVIQTGQTQGANHKLVMREQIAYTIEEHFRKQAKLITSGIKVLSLFFIDRVASYTDDNGLIKTLFDEEYTRLQATYPEWQGKSPDKVRAAYFASVRRRGGGIEYKDTQGASEADEDAYNLIMRDKERLLSFDEPVAFIFSHSALREGWDNPNVFQICTLNQTVSEIKKRQEVGRGIRLPVDQSGDRVRDEKINVLTIIVNESYKDYVGKYQGEIRADLGTESPVPPVANARKRAVSKLRKHYQMKPEFQELWEKIKHRTRYAVQIDTPKLLDAVMPALNALPISAPRIMVTRARLEVGASDEFVAAVEAKKGRGVTPNNQPHPNLVDLMANLMEKTTPPIKLTRRTLLEVLRRLDKPDTVLANPHGFATAAVRIMKEQVAEQLVHGIKYEKIGEWYEMANFEMEIESFAEYLEPSVRPGGREGASLYDQVIVESETVERDFVKGLEQRDDVLLYVKLPAWFTVPTPVGEYNPDWAIVIEPRDAHGAPTGQPKLYLVRETKSTPYLSKLRADERRKVICGERHFSGALGVDFAVVAKADELPS